MIKLKRFLLTLNGKFRTPVKRPEQRHSVIRETPLKERQGYEAIFDDDVMTVLYIPGRKDQCIVSFTGVGHALGGIDLQNPEFSRSGGDDTKIFVIDKNRSWGNDINWEKLKDLVIGLAPGADITTLGNSMGGFLAILSAPILGATQAIAFAPQWSIDPAIVPGEERWLEYRQKIKKIRHQDLSEAIRSRRKIFVFFGQDAKDLVHIKFFKEERAETFILESCGHDVAMYMKKEGVLYPAISACRENNNLFTLLAEANVHVAAYQECSGMRN